MISSPSKDSDQNWIRFFPVRMKKAWVLSYPLSIQRRLWSVWADAQAELSLRWAHKSFCWFCNTQAHMYNLLQGYIGAPGTPAHARICAAVVAASTDSDAVLAEADLLLNSNYKCGNPGVYFFDVTDPGKPKEVAAIILTCVEKNRRIGNQEQSDLCLHCLLWHVCPKT